MEKQENSDSDSDIRDRDAKQLCPMIRKERAEELARAGIGNNAARKRHTTAVLKSPYDAVSLLWRDGHKSTYVRHLHAKFREIL